VKVTWHASCQPAREMGIRDEPKSESRSPAARGVRAVTPAAESGTCCGVRTRTFSVRYPEISGHGGRQGGRRRRDGASELLAGDCGCLLNVSGARGRGEKQVARTTRGGVVSGSGPVSADAGPTDFHGLARGPFATRNLRANFAERWNGLIGKRAVQFAEFRGMAGTPFARGRGGGRGAWSALPELLERLEALGACERHSRSLGLGDRTGRANEAFPFRSSGGAGDASLKGKSMVLRGPGCRSHGTALQGAPGAREAATAPRPRLRAPSGTGAPTIRRRLGELDGPLAYQAVHPLGGNSRLRIGVAKGPRGRGVGSQGDRRQPLTGPLPEELRHVSLRRPTVRPSLEGPETSAGQPQVLPPAAPWPPSRRRRPPCRPPWPGDLRVADGEGPSEPAALPLPPQLDQLDALELPEKRLGLVAAPHLPCRRGRRRCQGDLPPAPPGPPAFNSDMDENRQLG